MPRRVHGIGTWYLGKSNRRMDLRFPRRTLESLLEG